MSICQVCTKEFVYDRSKGHRKHQCNTCIVNRRRQLVDQLALDYKGRKCCVCGYDRCKRSLQFHHLAPTQKDFLISGNWGLSWEKLRKELDKCVLVCANCHGEIHDGLIDVESLKE